MFRSENGEIYGPVDRAGLNAWAAEGRVSERCHLQLIGGDGRWEPATGWIDPRYASRSHQQASSQYVVSPNASPVHTVHDAYRSQPDPFGNAPDRGWLVFVFALLGIGCPIFTVLSLAIGIYDLRMMSLGLRNWRGRTLTRVSVAISGLMFVMQGLAFLVLLLEA